jgi:hypothetical protein
MWMDGQTDRQTDMTKLKVALQNVANAAKPADVFNRALTAKPSKISGRIKVLFFSQTKKDRRRNKLQATTICPI